MNKILAEMLTGIANGQNKEQVFMEIVELMDSSSRKKVYNYLQVKVLASLRMQATTIEEAIKRYGAE